MVIGQTQYHLPTGKMIISNLVFLVLNFGNSLCNNSQ